jgi:hypothetical protein
LVDASSRAKRVTAPVPNSSARTRNSSGEMTEPVSEVWKLRLPLSKRENELRATTRARAFSTRSVGVSEVTSELRNSS